MRTITGTLAALAAALAFGWNATAHAETTECTEITTIPTVITVQGVYCLKGNLGTDMTSGAAIDIQTNNVTIDFNGWKLGGLAAGAATSVRGVQAVDRRNIKIRNGSIRGFLYGVSFSQSAADLSSGHIVEDMTVDANTFVGIQVGGAGVIIRNNQIVNTGPGDVASIGYGITVVSHSRNSLVADNLISNTTETQHTRGIYVNASSQIEIRGNSVLESVGGSNTNHGIHLTSDTSEISIIDNRLLNPPGTGSHGIYAVGSDNTDCINNVIRGFTTPTLSCDGIVSGNLTSP